MADDTHVMTDEDRIIAGIEARQVLASPVVQAAFHSIEAQAIEELVNSEVVDDVKRCRLVERIRAIRDVKSAIDSVRMTGKITARNTGNEFPD